jgi:hypothetical protein
VPTKDPRRSRRIIILSVFAGIIVVAGLANAVGGIFGDPAVRVVTTTTGPSTTTTVVALAKLGKGGKALDELAASGRDAEFHAVYTVSDPKLPQGLEQSVEVWRNANKFRSDIIERDGAGTRRQTALDDGVTRRKCETVKGTQTCQITDVAPVDLVVAFIRAVADAKDQPDLAVHQETNIAGYQARCFDAGDTGEVCLTTDGVMLRLKLQGATITASRLEPEVPASAFDVSG